MGANSKIAWCDHTFNPWLGCTKISPARENCCPVGSHSPGAHLEMHVAHRVGMDIVIAREVAL
jgi:protein gp37